MDSNERFVTELTSNQERLLAYICSLVGDRAKSADILQETNLALWRKKEEYQSERPFLPWAFTFARLQVMAFLRDQKRERLVITPDLAESVSMQVEMQVLEMGECQVALEACLASLDEEKRELIHLRYRQSKSIAALAQQMNRGVSDIKVSLLRIRQKLASCIEKRLDMNSRGNA